MNIFMKDESPICESQWWPNLRYVNKVEDLPMNRKWIDDDRHALLRGHVAEALNENEAHYSLVIGQASIDRQVHVVVLHWDSRGDCAVDILFIFYVCVERRNLLNKIARYCLLETSI